MYSGTFSPGIFISFRLPFTCWLIGKSASFNGCPPALRAISYTSLGITELNIPDSAIAPGVACLNGIVRYHPKPSFFIFALSERWNPIFSSNGVAPSSSIIGSGPAALADSTNSTEVAEVRSTCMADRYIPRV